MEVYLYVSSADADSILECGLRLTIWADRHLGENRDRKFISAFLNPRDDIEKFKHKDYVCLKIKAKDDESLIAEKLLYDWGIKDSNMLKLYENTALKPQRYRLGFFRNPEYLIGHTVLPQDIEIMRKGLDSPLLYNSSQQLFTSLYIEEAKEKDESFLDKLLFYFFDLMAQKGLLYKFENNDLQTFVYYSREENRVFALKDPQNN